VLLGTAVLYLWDLVAVGDGNAFYAAAVQAGTKSWTALFFGSLDAANLITVDKPPASLWVMELSGRVFGFSSASMLVPQVLMAVAATALLWAAVRRSTGPGAALLAAGAFALTPVAVVMFRFNNPDALLVLLLIAAGYAVTRAIEAASTRWLLLAGLIVGFAFLAKELQAFLVLPGLALAYLWAAPTTPARRIRQLAGAGIAIVAGAGWWVLAVALWPVAQRPYIGGSADNSELGRALGYNGLSRIFGGGRGGRGPAAVGGPAGVGGPVGPGSGSGGQAAGEVPGAPGFLGRGTGGHRFGGLGGQPGLTRLFDLQVGGQISWLLPTALIMLVVGLVLTRGRPRQDRTRAGLLLWGSWTVVAALVLSLMQGNFHPYYTLVLAPGIAASLAIGGELGWRARNGHAGRDSVAGRVGLAAATAATAFWAWWLLARTPDFVGILRWAALGLGLIAAIGLALPATRRGGALVLGIAVLIGAAGPAAYDAYTVATAAHVSPMASAGPPAAGTAFGYREVRGGPRARPGRQDSAPAASGAVPGGAPPAGARPVGAGPVGAAPAGWGGPAAGWAGGAGRGRSTNTALLTLLRGASTRWSAATSGSSAAASLELASDTSVMGIGGFTGADPAPTLEQFTSYIAQRQVRYFVTGGSGPPRGGGRGGGASAAITAWVAQHYAPTTVGGQTVYDLTVPR
jgi:4-amino-4-deoxy-L-arabinose transferase-like glycosyltransferase